jgi:hypothetical protein
MFGASRMRRITSAPNTRSYVHTVKWWTQHWEKIGLVEVQCAELLPESDDLLGDYAGNRPPEQDEDSIMRAVPQDHDGLHSSVL